MRFPPSLPNPCPYSCQCGQTQTHGLALNPSLLFPGPSPPVLLWVILVYTAVIHLCTPGPRLAAIAELSLPPPGSIMLTYSPAQLFDLFCPSTVSASHSPGQLHAPSRPYHVIRTQLLPDLSTLPLGSSSPGR
ncbi:unnamed protein product [Arctogadus glacialis]